MNTSLPEPLEPCLVWRLWSAPYIENQWLAGAGSDCGSPDATLDLGVLDTVTPLTLDFSSRSALKNKSRGESVFRVAAGLAFVALVVMEGWAASCGGDSLLSDVSSSSFSRRACRLDSDVAAGTDLEKNLGIGSDEAAGEAWNVGPA